MFLSSTKKATYLVAVATGVLTLLNWVKSKKCPYDALGIFGGKVTIVVSVTWGSFNDWGRLLIYVVPFVFAGITICVRDIGHATK